MVDCTPRPGKLDPAKFPLFEFTRGCSSRGSPSNGCDIADGLRRDRRSNGAKTPSASLERIFNRDGRDMRTTDPLTLWVHSLTSKLSKFDMNSIDPAIRQLTDSGLMNLGTCCTRTVPGGASQLRILKVCISTSSQVIQQLNELPTPWETTVTDKVGLQEKSGTTWTIMTNATAVEISTTGNGDPPVAALVEMVCNRDMTMGETAAKAASDALIEVLTGAGVKVPADNVSVLVTYTSQ